MDFSTLFRSLNLKIPKNSVISFDTDFNLNPDYDEPDEPEIINERLIITVEELE